VLIDIVILPPEKLRQKLGKRIKKEAADYPAGFIVDNKKFIPHLSLWHLNVSGGKRIGKITEELEKIVKNQKAVKVNSSGFGVSAQNIGATFHFNIREDKALMRLKEEVFWRTYRLKTGMMPPYKPFGIWTGKSLKEARKYGKPLGVKLHMTMGWLKNEEDAPKVQKRMKKVKFSFTAKEIYICRVNHWWQVDKIIKKINFGNAR
jgi:methionine aminopeptidase